MNWEKLEDTAILLIAFKCVDAGRVVEIEAARYLDGVSSVHMVLVNDVNSLARDQVLH